MLDRLKDWVYGGESFLRRMAELAEDEGQATPIPRGLSAGSLTADDVIEATARVYGVDPKDYTGFRRPAAGRDVAAYLCRRHTTATLRELSDRFGLSHKDSSGDLVRRAERLRRGNAEVCRRIDRIEAELTGTTNPESRL